MTGFGLSSFIDKKSEIYIEIKGVNHKFLEATIKPNDLNNELEAVSYTHLTLPTILLV